MRLAEWPNPPAIEEKETSLCSLSIGEDRFAFQTSQVREVLGKHDLRPVPLTPWYVLGIIPYRGEVLTILSLRALLGKSLSTNEGTVLVLQDDKAAEPLGLIIDAMLGVTSLGDALLEPNPATLDERSRYLFDGSYQLPSGSMIRLDASRLQPEKLAAAKIFEAENKGANSCAR